MMGVISKIFGSGKVIEEGFKLIDSIHTSDVEEIQAKTDSKVRLIEAYQPYKLAQRYLALMFSAVFLFCFFLVLAMTMMNKGDLTEVRAVVSEFWIGEIMTLIIGFYFGGGFKESWDRGKNGKPKQ